MKHITPLFFACLLLSLLSCDSEHITGPAGTPPPLPYQAEAEQMALYYSSELTPPTYLTWAISHELKAIRETFASSIPELSRPIMLPWKSNTVKVYFNDSVAQIARSGNYHAWDSLVSKYSITIQNPSYFPRFFRLEAAVAVHPQLLAMQFRTLPGVTYASAEEWPVSSMWPPCARAESGSTVNYYFWVEKCPELYGRVVWIQVRDRRAVWRGSHYECSPETDKWFAELPYWDAYKKWDDYIAKAEATRPAWVDSARAEFQKVSFFGPNNEWQSMYLQTSQDFSTGLNFNQLRDSRK